MQVDRSSSSRGVPSAARYAATPSRAGSSAAASRSAASVIAAAATVGSSGSAASQAEGHAKGQRACIAVHASLEAKAVYASGMPSGRWSCAESGMLCTIESSGKAEGAGDESEDAASPAAAPPAAAPEPVTTASPAAAPLAAPPPAPEAVPSPARPCDAIATACARRVSSEKKVASAATMLAVVPRAEASSSLIAIVMCGAASTLNATPKPTGAATVISYSRGARWRGSAAA